MSIWETEIEHVSSCQSVGVTKDETENPETEINNPIEKANNVYYVVNIEAFLTTKEYRHEQN